MIDYGEKIEIEVHTHLAMESVHDKLLKNNNGLLKTQWQISTNAAIAT